MKKLFYVVFAMVAITFAACGNKAQEEATEQDSTVVDSIAVTDTVNVDSALVVETESTVCPD